MRDLLNDYFIICVSLRLGFCWLLKKKKNCYQLTKGDGQPNHNPSSSFAIFATILQIHIHQILHNKSI